MFPGDARLRLRGNCSNIACSAKELGCGGAGLVERDVPAGYGALL